MPDSPRGPWAPSGPRAPVGPASPWQEGGKTRCGGGAAGAVTQFPPLGAAPPPLPWSQGRRESQGLRLGRQVPGGGREEREGLRGFWGAGGVPGDSGVTPRGTAGGPGRGLHLRGVQPGRGAHRCHEHPVGVKTVVGVTGGGGSSGGGGEPPPHCHRRATGVPLRHTHRSTGGAGTSSLSGQPSGTLVVVGDTAAGQALRGKHPPPPPLPAVPQFPPFPPPKNSPWGRGSRSHRGSRIHPAGTRQDGVTPEPSTHPPPWGGAPLAPTPPRAPVGSVTHHWGTVAPPTHLGSGSPRLTLGTVQARVALGTEKWGCHPPVGRVTGTLGGGRFKEGGVPLTR